MSRYGTEEIEGFLDTCLSLENCIDLHAPHIRRHPLNPPTGDAGADEEPEATKIPRLPVVRRYLDPYVNPAEFLEKQKKKLERERKKNPKRQTASLPERDVLLCLMEHAPLKNWQRDLLDVIREEAYYFAPQGQTKIMNEGWATYWHSTIMTQRALTDAEVIDFADHCSGTVGSSTGRLNPYKIGLELFRYIEDKWNRGRFGKDYDECADLERKRRWDKHLGLGRQKIFEVRRLYSDVTFIDEFLDEEFAKNQKLFTYAYNQHTNNWEITSRDFPQIKRQLLFSLTNFGQPVIEVIDINDKNRGELLLLHKHEGVDLKIDWAQATLEALVRLWTRPVQVRTVVDGKPTLMRFDGTEHSSETISNDNQAEGSTSP